MNLDIYLESLLNNDVEPKIKMNVTGAVIVRKNEEDMEEVLLIRRSEKDKWKLIWEYPRGKCDKTPNEKLKNCLFREVKEETGLDIEIISYIDNYQYIADNGNRLSTQYNFLCKMKNPNQKVKLSFEHDEFRWVSEMGEIELLVPYEMKKTISKVLNTKTKIVDYEKEFKTISNNDDEMDIEE